MGYFGFFKCGFSSGFSGPRLNCHIGGVAKEPTFSNGPPIRETLHCAPEADQVIRASDFGSRVSGLGFRVLFLGKAYTRTPERIPTSLHAEPIGPTLSSHSGPPPVSNEHVGGGGGGGGVPKIRVLFFGGFFVLAFRISVDFFGFLFLVLYVEGWGGGGGGIFGLPHLGKYHTD